MCHYLNPYPMNEREISRALATRVANSDGPRDSKPEAWAVGITNDPTERKKQRMDDGELVVNWRECKAYSKAMAEALERYWKRKGMKGGT